MAACRNYRARPADQACGGGVGGGKLAEASPRAASLLPRTEVNAVGPSVDPVRSAADRACPAQGAVFEHSAGGQWEHLCPGVGCASCVEPVGLEAGLPCFIVAIVAIVAASCVRQCDPALPPSPTRRSGWATVRAIRHGLTARPSQRKPIGTTVISLKHSVGVGGSGSGCGKRDPSTGAP